MSINWMKCVIVGNKGVGKSLIYYAYAMKSFQQGSALPQGGNLAVDMMTKGGPISLGLWDTTDDDDEEDRKLNYQCTDVLLLAFSLVDPESFSSIVSIWNPEVEQYCPGVPKILVGSKLVLRDDNNTVLRLIERGFAPISSPQALQVMKDIGAIDYVECSATACLGVDYLFNHCVTSALNRQFERTTKKWLKF